MNKNKMILNLAEANQKNLATIIELLKKAQETEETEKNEYDENGKCLHLDEYIKVEEVLGGQKIKYCSNCGEEL